MRRNQINETPSREDVRNYYSHLTYSYRQRMGAAGHYQKETEDEANSSHSKLSDGEQSKPPDTI